MTVEIRLLGTLEVRVDGDRVGPGPESGKPWCLLALLTMHHDRIVAKDWLVDRMWSDPPATARNLVEKHVSLWRKALGADRVETVGSGYRLHLEPGEADLLVLRARLEEGRALAAAGDHAGAAARLGAAVALWSGADVEAFARDLLPAAEAQGLVDLHLHGLEDWAHAVLVAGTDDDVVEPLRQALDAHPYRERLAELLLWALARRGDHAEAGEVYRRTRQALRADLGQEPGEDLQRMHQRVLRLDPELRPRPAGGPLVGLPPRRHAFTGREQEIPRVTELLERGVAIAGGVGIGKTALALEVAHRRVDDYAVAWFLNARSATSLADGLEALGRALGTPLPDDRSAGLGRLWEAVRRRGRCLLVVDDAGSPAELADLWPPEGTATLLVTSLNPDWAGYLPVLELAELGPEESVRLLRERGLPGDDGTARRLAAELGGLPLACEQAAAYIRQTGMDTARYLALFRQRRAELLDRGLPDGRGTIAATWRLAEARLAATPAAVQLARLLAALGPEDVPLDLLRADPEALPEPLASAVADELALEDAIRELRQYSLVGRAGRRIRMHPLLQAVVAAAAPAEAPSWRERAAQMLAAGAPGGTAPATWPDWLLLVPHVVAVAAPDPVPLAPGVVPLLHRTADYLVTRGAFDDARRLLERLLESARSAGVDDLEVGRTLVELGDVLAKAGEPARAIEAHEEALVLFRSHWPADHPWVARSVAGLTTALTCHSGVSLWRAQDLPDVKERFLAALGVLRESLGPRDPVVAHALSGLGQVLQDSGDVAGGVNCQEQALDILVAAYGHDHPDVGHVYGKLGYALALQRDFERARYCQEESLRVLAAAFGPDHPEAGWPLSNLGVLHLDAGNVEQAIALQEDACRIFEAVDADDVPVLITRWRLARALLAARRTAEAVALLAAVAPALSRALGSGHADAEGAAADLERAGALLAGSTPARAAVTVADR